ncbi:MAG TPA: hypothetical protein VIL52_08560 [Bacteroidota bacterium]
MNTLLSILALLPCIVREVSAQNQQGIRYTLEQILGDNELTTISERADTLKYAIPVLRDKDTLMMVTMHGGRELPDRIVLWKKIGQFYSEVTIFESSPEGPVVDFLEEPNVFIYQGERILHIQHNYRGTGNYHEDTLFVVHPDGEIQGVYFEPAPNGCEHLLTEKEAVWKGEMNNFSDDAMEFVFAIWNTEIDANCCPTAGRVTGTYKLVRQQGSRPNTMMYKIMVDTFQRVPIKEN